MIYQGPTPTLPGSDRWKALPEAEQKAINADYAEISKAAGAAPGLPLGLPNAARTVQVKEGKPQASVRVPRSVQQLSRWMRADAQLNPSGTDRGRAGASATIADVAFAVVSGELRDGVARQRGTRLEALLLGLLPPSRASAARAVTCRHRRVGSPRRCAYERRDDRTG